MQKLLKELDIMSDSYQPLSNVYQLRCKGLTEKLTNDELTAAILHITKHRGSCIDTVQEDASKANDELSLKATLQKNEQLLKQGKYICEIQLERLNEKNNVRGHENNFNTKDYEKELREILKHQDLDYDTVQKIVGIITRRRAYYDGPGSVKSPTPYGQWYIENGELKHVDMIEKMRGKCSVFPDELRAPKMSLTADLFNFLNDLNNLTISEEKLEVDQKTEIFPSSIKKEKSRLKRWLNY